MGSNKNKFSKVKAGVVAVAFIGASAVGTMALMTDTSTTDIKITSANLGLTVNGADSGTYIVDIESDNLKPGENRSGEITLLNDSSIPATITVDKSTLGAGWNQSLTNEDGEQFTTVNVEGGESVNLNLTIGMDSDVTEPLEDDSLKITFNSEQN